MIVYHLTVCKSKKFFTGKWPERNSARSRRPFRKRALSLVQQEKGLF